MEMQQFEEKLVRMTKPEIPQLKHQDMLENAIAKAKDKSVLSGWWLGIPLYIVAALIMKSVYMPGTSLVSDLHELFETDKFISIVFFLVVPAVFTILNFFAIRETYFLSGNPKTINFLRIIWTNILMVIVSLLILLIYSL